MVRINSLNTSFAVRQFEKMEAQNARTQRRLSSGEANVYASDNATAVGLSTRIRAQVLGIRDATLNAQQALSLMQTAEGGISDINDMLRRIHSLAAASANDTLTDADRGTFQIEVDQILAEVDREADTAAFNEIPLLNGNNRTLTFHVGPNQNETVSSPLITDVRTTTLGLNGLSVSTRADSETALDTVELAMNTIQGIRTDIAATSTRLETIIDLNSDLHLNQSAGLSRIADADMAGEMVENVKGQVLTSMAIGVISDANTENSRVGHLLAGTITESNSFI